jgi:hypothetical protein
MSARNCFSRGSETLGGLKVDRTRPTKRVGTRPRERTSRELMIKMVATGGSVAAHAQPLNPVVQYNASHRRAVVCQA